MTRSTIAAIALVMAVALPHPAQAQGLFGKIKKKAEDKVNQASDRAAQQVVDGSEQIIRCSAGDKACLDRAKQSGKTVVTSTGDTIRPPAPAAPAAASASAAVAAPAEGATAGAAGTGVWVNYDFKPGNRPIFIEDLMADEVGDFPRRLKLGEGNIEIADVGGRRMLRMTSTGAVYIQLPETLPERFTIEADVSSTGGWMYAHFKDDVTRYGSMSGSDADTHLTWNFISNSGGLEGGSVQSQSAASRDLRGKTFPLRLMVDGAYAKMYADDKRVANVPEARINRGRRVVFTAYATEDTPFFLGNIRVMAGGRQLYDVLAEKGRVATQGIYFDTGSDRVRGESSATLKEIAQMLTTHGELKLTIEGHTDNVGAATDNQALSERRAAAVRAALVSTYGVSADRLTAKGYGAAKPAAPNEAPEGRQQNRRVELVKS